MPNPLESEVDNEVLDAGIVGMLSELHVCHPILQAYTKDWAKLTQMESFKYFNILTTI